LAQKKFTFTLDIETIETMNVVISETKPKYRSQSHFVVIAIQNLIDSEHDDLLVDEHNRINEEMQKEQAKEKKDG